MLNTISSIFTDKHPKEKALVFKALSNIAWTCEDALCRHEHSVHIRAPGHQPLAPVVSLQPAAVPGPEPLQQVIVNWYITSDQIRWWYPHLAQLVGAPHATRGQLTQTLWPAVVPMIDYCIIIQLETNFREVFTISRAFSLLKASTTAFTFKNLFRHFNRHKVSLSQCPCLK